MVCSVLSSPITQQYPDWHISLISSLTSRVCFAPNPTFVSLMKIRFVRDIVLVALPCKLHPFLILVQPTTFNLGYSDASLWCYRLHDFLEFLLHCTYLLRTLHAWPDVAQQYLLLLLPRHCCLRMYQPPKASCPSMGQRRCLDDNATQSSLPCFSP